MLEILGIFDWISPAIAGVRILFGGKTPISVFWDDRPPMYYEKLLKKRGFAANTGSVVAGHGFYILVPRKKKRMARRILAQAGAQLALRRD